MPITTCVNIFVIINKRNLLKKETYQESVHGNTAEYLHISN